MVGLFLISVHGCKKEIPNNHTKIISTWDTCKNKIAKEKDYRIGEWHRINKHGPIEPTTIRFINDSMVDIYNKSINKWYLNLKYRFLHCGQFDFDNYLKPPNPPFQNWRSVITDFDETNNHWYLIEPGQFLPDVETEFDTSIFEKRY